VAAAFLAADPEVLFWRRFVSAFAEDVAMSVMLILVALTVFFVFAYNAGLFIHRW
jgi:hypothetical protein